MLGRKGYQLHAPDNFQFNYLLNGFKKLLVLFLVLFVPTTARSLKLENQCITQVQTLREVRFHFGFVILFYSLLNMVS